MSDLMWIKFFYYSGCAVWGVFIGFATIFIMFFLWNYTSFCVAYWYCRVKNPSGIKQSYRDLPLWKFRLFFRVLLLDFRCNISNMDCTSISGQGFTLNLERLMPKVTIYK